MAQPVDGPQDIPFEFLRRVLSTSQTSQDVLSSIGWNTEDFSKLRDQHPKIAECIKLAYVLWRIDRLNSLPLFLEHGVSDVWFPFSKQTLRHFLKDVNSEKKFLQWQTELVLEYWPSSTDEPVPHLIFDDGEEIVKSERILGEGGFAIVEEVTLPTMPLPTVCVRKRIGRPRQLRTQKQIIEAFVREIKIMSLVDHHHCVRFLGSYTDHDSLSILSLPVADMDLAVYLNLDLLDQEQLGVISRGIGCLCNALHYLHQQKIRHEDLKPQNVLIHGETILLTDFGFSLDFSNDSVSTTVGRPSHWTARYSAPETLDHQARNRATDVWSLGCILVEMLSRLHGRCLSEMTIFWKQTGTGHPSFSMNTEATTEWLDILFREIDSGDKVLILYKFIRTMLQFDRLLRPSTQQIVDKIKDLEFLFPAGLTFVDNCCKSRGRDLDEVQRINSFNSLFPLPDYLYPDVLDSHTFLLVDWDGVAFGFKDNWPMNKSKGQSLDTYFASPNNLKDICRSLWERTSLSAHEEKRAVRQLAIRSHHDGEFLACLSVRINSFNKLGFERTTCEIKLPMSSFENRLRLIQVAIVPICFPRSELHECYFFIISFKPDDIKSQAQNHEKEGELGCEPDYQLFRGLKDEVEKYIETWIETKEDQEYKSNDSLSRALEAEEEKLQNRRERLEEFHEYEPDDSLSRALEAEVERLQNQRERLEEFHEYEPDDSLSRALEAEEERLQNQRERLEEFHEYEPDDSLSRALKAEEERRLKIEKETQEELQRYEFDDSLSRALKAEEERHLEIEKETQEELHRYETDGNLHYPEH